LSDNYVFITRSDFHNIEVDEIIDLRVGLRKNTHYSELFKEMFPDHKNYIEYDTQQENWAALYHGDNDGIFASRRRLLVNTNFYEETGFKLNIIFDLEFDTSFGFNKDAAIIKSIVDKALGLININNISKQWMSKTYDYRVKLAEAQRPLYTGAAILTFLVLLLALILLIRSRSIGRQLENMVKQRTSALAFETSKLKAMIDSIPDLMFCKDTNFKYTQCNKHFEDFWGVRETDMIGKTDEDGKMVFFRSDNEYARYRISYNKRGENIYP